MRDEAWHDGKVVSEIRDLRLSRPVVLRLQGDWGQQNFHRICGWISQELLQRSPRGTRTAIWDGRGGTDVVSALREGHVDLGLSTPATFTRMALDGVGPYEGRPAPWLRSLAILPQVDRMIFALHSSVGVRSLDDLRDRRPPLRLTTGVDDGINHIGWAGHRIIEACGIAPSVLRSRGGTLLVEERPDLCLEHARCGRADAVVQEAIMTHWWADLMATGEWCLISLDADVARGLSDAYGWKTADVPRGFYPEVNVPATGMEFSDFAVLVRDDLDDELAYVLAGILVETRGTIEAQYRHLPPNRSPLTYPLEPAAMAASPVPLHPGAEKYYRDHAILPRREPSE